MTPEQFAYWLQGYFELTGNDVSLSSEQTQIIKSHLDLVFDNVTRRPLLVDDLPQSVLARYERDVRSTAVVISRRC